jgi:BON domain
VKLLGRLTFLPVKLVLAAIEAAFRAGRLAGAIPLRAGRRTSRLLGARGTFGLVLGLAVGLAFAPWPGRELRARVRQILARLRQLLAGQSGVNDDDLMARVSFELEHAPRTWHLPQPSVTVDQGRVTLRGGATEPSARDELGRVAGGVPGVNAVENLVVADDDTDGGRLAASADGRDAKAD